MNSQIKIISFIPPILLLIFCAIAYTFLAGEVTKVDVSDSVVVPENYENLLVLDVTIPSAKNLKKDTILHNGQAGSAPGDTLESFSTDDRFSDHNLNQAFDGNQTATDNEAIIFSSDNTLDSSDTVKNSGTAFIKSFKYSSGVYEQYIDNNHSGTYTSGEAVVRTSTTGDNIYQGAVIRNGSADMTHFSSYIKFTDGIQPSITPPKYQNGEAIIVDIEPAGILTGVDTILKSGNAGLKAFPNDIAYLDPDGSNKFSSDEAIINDKGTKGKLDPSDIILKSGKANLKPLGANEYYADSNNDGKFDSGELVITDTSGDLKVQANEIRVPGFANLRAMSGEGLLFSDDNKNTLFNANELIVRNNGSPEILESSDIIVKSGKADLRPFTSGIDKFIDANKNGVYDDGECITHDSGTIGKIEPNDIEKLGLAILQPFSGKNYLYTDANNDSKYTGNPNSEAILQDKNANGLIDNGELVTAGYAPIKSFAKPLWFIDANSNNAYDNGESIIMSDDNKLSPTDVVVIPGPAFLTIFTQGIVRWAEVNGNNKYDEDEMIVGSADDIISFNEVIKPGLCNLKPFPAKFNGYLYSDDNDNGNYSNDELIIASSDGILDSNDTVIRQGKAILSQFLTTSNLFIDTNRNNAFDQNEAIIKNNNPTTDIAVLDSSDEVVKTGTVDAKSFGDNFVYIDQNNDGRFQGDSDSDVVWDKSADPMSANDPDIIADQDEVMLNDAIGQKHLALDDGDIVIRPGVARLRNFAGNYRYIDHYNKDEFSGSTANEAIIQDSDGILDSTDVVITAGKASITNFTDEKFIDDNGDGSYTFGELIWRDSGSSFGKLDSSDEIIKPGYASLLSMSGYKYTNDGVNSNFTGAQAIINDKSPLGILSKNDLQIKPGTADVKNFGANEKFVDGDGDGKYTDGEPIIYGSGGTLTIINPGTIGNFTEKIRYIDADNSGFYSASGSPLAKTDTEAIIGDNGDKELNAGKLDGTSADRIIVQGKAKIKPIGSFASQLKPANPQINAFIDKNLNDQPDDYEFLITDNAPTGILDPSDFVWGKINFTDDFYNWSGTQIASINGSTLSPPNSAINAYIDSYNFGSLDNYEVLIKDNAPLGTLDPNDVVYGEIKNKTTGAWSSSLEDGLPWRLIMQAFGSQEKFLTGKTITTYNGQPIINESTGGTPNQWDKDDLMVYDGTPPRGINANWGQMRYVDNNHNGSYTLNECIIDLSLVPPNHDIVYPDIVITEGAAGFGDFPPQQKFCDQSVKNGIYDIDEPLINDANNNNMIDPGEIVSSGMVTINDLRSPLKYTDANHNGKFNGNEAIILDGGNSDLLDVGLLNGVDKVISSGEADITSFKRAEKYVDGNNNNSFDAGEAIIYDWYSSGFAGEFILAGNHVDKNGTLTYLPPGSRNRDCVILNGEANKSAMIELNDRQEQKYIDANGSNSYNGFYDVFSGIDYEPIISSSDNQLNKGKLDGSGVDSLIASGYCFRAWDVATKWSDSNHDKIYQDNEAIVYDALNDGIIKSIGTGANDDKIIVSGNADLNDFQYMKYVDANGNNDVDFGTELTAKDADQDNKLRNEEIGDQGLITFLKPFTASDYRFCDWNKDGAFDSQQEPIIYTPTDPDILGKEDEIVASGSYPGLKGFNPQPNFVDYNHDNDYDSDEAIISGDGDQILEATDQIIIHGKASSFDGTNIKYVGESYVDGALIADTVDNILSGSEVLTAGNVNLTAFNVNDKYSDSNHNGRYDYKAYGTNFGEAIISDNGDNMIEIGEVKTSGYADLRTFDGTNFKYSDSGARDQFFNDGELMINDINSDNKVDPSEVVYEGTADLKKFSSNVMFCDANNDGVYASSEALVSSDDDILQSTDKVLAEGNANLRAFEQNLYRFADSDYNDTYSTGEAIIVEYGWGTVDDLLEKTDIIILDGTAGIKTFPSNFMFLDDSVDSGEYEEGEAIVNDLNGNGQLDTTDEIVTSGRASLKRFATNEKYTDGGSNAGNSLYDVDEAIIRDGNTDGKLNAGPLDGTGVDAVLMPGKAGLRHFDNNERYVDANGNSQYDGNEDIYRDEDSNRIVTGDGSDQLVYFAIENIGNADKGDLVNARLWADRDRDGQFEPGGDDSPSVKTLSADSSYNMWFEGPVNSPPLSLRSNKASIAYPMPNNQRFFVTVDTSANAVDGRDIQMRIPINGVKTLYGLPSPSDNPVLNAYKQFIDRANPNKAIITSPLENDAIYGQITLRVDAGDSVGVGKVEFYDGRPDGIKQPIAVDDNGSPWEAVWDCTNAGFGEHTIYARVFDKTYQRPPKTKTINHYLDSAGVRVIVGIKHTIALSAGWNYVSLPVEPFNSSVPSLLASIGAKARSIWAYDAVTERWLRYDLDGPAFLNDLTTVKAGVGYQLFMTDSSVLNVVGTLPNGAINLKNGWNLVGCNAQKAISVENAIASIKASSPSVWTVNSNGEWLGYDPNNPPNDLSTIEPGKAYWIRVVGNCQWVVDVGY